MYNHSDNTSHIITDLFQDMQYHLNPKQGKLAHYHQIKPLIWEQYSHHMYHAFKNYSYDASAYKQATASLESIHFSLLNNFDDIIETTRDFEIKGYFLAQKLKTLYYYLMYAYSLRRIPFPGTWSLIHETFTAYQNLPEDSTHKQTEELYKKCLIFALFRPYNLSFKASQSLTEHVDEFASLLKFEKFKSKAKDQVVINTEKDLPFVDAAIEQITFDRQFKAVGIKKLRSRLRLIQKDPYFYKVQRLLGYDLLSAEIASELLENLNASSIRIYDRSSSNVACQCTLTFSKTWHYIQALQGKQPAAELSAVILNKSDGGMCLQIQQRHMKDLEKGQIIGIGESQQSDSFYVGLVRWIQEISCDKILIGIEKIAINPFAVKCHLNGVDQPETLSLLFQAKKVCLLTPMYPFKSGFALALNHHKQTPEGFSLGREYRMGRYRVFELD